jgi:hypothetical protein
MEEEFENWALNRSERRKTPEIHFSRQISGLYA